MRRVGTIVSVVSLLATARLMAACPSDEAEHAEAVGSEEPAASSAPQHSEPASEPAGPAETVELTTSDGRTLAATLRRGGRPDATAVILVHGLASDRSEWERLVETLGEPPGLTTLALDMRGHGDSEGGPDGWRDFAQGDWPTIRRDVVAAAGFLSDADGLEPERIVGVGASLGSSAVVLAAADDDRIDALALLSPGRAYRGVDAITPVGELGDRPLLAVAAKGEAHSAQTSMDIARIAARGAHRLVDGDAHGVFMLGEAPQMRSELVAFLRDPQAQDAP